MNLDVRTMRNAILLAVLCLPCSLAAQQAVAGNDRYRAAQEAYDNGRYESAAHAFEQANAELSNHCAACLAMAARAYGRAKQRPLALTLSARAVELASSPAERSNAHMQRGSVFLEQRETPADLVSAEAEARSALAEDPQSLPARVLLGLALLRQGRADDGVRELQLVATSPAADDDTRQAAQHWIADPARQRLEFVPDFHGTTITGEPFSLAALKGKIVLLDFWATWCVPCRVGLPDLKQLHEQYKDRLVIVSISVDENKESWRAFVESNEMSWTQLHDTGQNLRILLDAKVCPTYLLLDRTGVVRLRVNGMDPDRSLRSMLEPDIAALIR